MRIDNPGSRDRPCLQHCLECLVAFLEGGSGEVDADFQYFLTSALSESESRTTMSPRSTADRSFSAGENILSVTLGRFFFFSMVVKGGIVARKIKRVRTVQLTATAQLNRTTTIALG